MSAGVYGVTAAELCLWCYPSKCVYTVVEMARVSKPGAEALCLLSVFLGLCVGVCPFSATLCVCVVEPTSPGSQSVHVHNQTTQRFSLECLVSFFSQLVVLSFCLILYFGCWKKQQYYLGEYWKGGSEGRKHDRAAARWWLWWGCFKALGVGIGFWWGLRGWVVRCAHREGPGVISVLNRRSS